MLSSSFELLQLFGEVSFEKLSSAREAKGAQISAGNGTKILRRSGSVRRAPRRSAKH
jgi:hypothetical protein